MLPVPLGCALQKQQKHQHPQPATTDDTVNGKIQNSEDAIVAELRQKLQTEMSSKAEAENKARLAEQRLEQELREVSRKKDSEFQAHTQNFLLLLVTPQQSPKP